MTPVYLILDIRLYNDDLEHLGVESEEFHYERRAILVRDENGSLIASVGTETIAGVEHTLIYSTYGSLVCARMPSAEMLRFIAEFLDGKIITASGEPELFQQQQEEPA